MSAMEGYERLLQELGKFVNLITLKAPDVKATRKKAAEFIFWMCKNEGTES